MASTAISNSADPNELIPTRASAALFAMRVAALRIRRGVADAFAGIVRYEQVDDTSFSVLACESRSELWSDHRAAEAAHQRGKIHNLSRAVRELNGALLPAHGVFSFWKQIGRATEGRGFVAGRTLQQGCMIPTTGGGLCQLSNAIYEVALRASCEIVERHSHSRIVPGSAAAFGRDATVAWNYVDLRFRVPQDIVMRAQVTESELVVSLFVRAGTPLAASRCDSFGLRPDKFVMLDAPGAPLTCSTCQKTSCFRRER